MEKKLNLLGIRKKVILCHTKSLAGVTYIVMRPITEEDEQNLDKFEYLDIDKENQQSIYLFKNIDQLFLLQENNILTIKPKK